MRQTDSQASVKVWDEVAKDYLLELSNSDKEIGTFLIKLLESLNIYKGHQVLELGCGSGHISAILAQAGYKVGLLDFSNVALDKAYHVFEENGLKATCYCQDFFKMDLDTIYDVIWNSGVMEHFNHKEIVSILQNVKKHTKRYFIAIVPNPKSLPYLLFRYNEMSKDQWKYDYEYLRDNYEEVVEEAGMKVVHTSYVGKELTKYLFTVGNDGKAYKTYFEEMSQNQLLPEEELYLKVYVIDTKPGLVEERMEEAEEVVERDRIEEITNRFDLISKVNGYKRKSQELDALSKEITKQLEETNESLKMAQAEVEVKLHELEEKERLLQENSKQLEVQSVQIKNEQLKTEKIEAHLNHQNEKVLELAYKLEEEKQALEGANTQLEETKQRLGEKENKINEVQEALSQVNEQLHQTKNQLDEKSNQLAALEVQTAQERRNLTSENEGLKQELQVIYGSTFWKVATRYYRIRDGVWPINVIFRTLKRRRAQKLNKNVLNGGQVVQQASFKEVLNEAVSIEPLNLNSTTLVEQPISVIKPYQIIIQDERYQKQDIIVLSVIDWDFRFQRPQHLAKGLSQLGHRTFYFNANYHQKSASINQIKENLYMVTLSQQFGERIYNINFTEHLEAMKQEISEILHGYNVRECSVIVEYPTWEPVVRYLKEVFGFKVVFDYIDDYTGFEDTAHMGLVKDTKSLLEISDLTIATSTFLAEKAATYSKQVKIIRNGTEFDYFNRASATKAKKSKMKIGYYGAIAEWFDMKVVAYIAEHRPDVEIELIGQVTCETCHQLATYKNIKFLGEKKYDELWKYLQDFDVCLIPFKSDIDLIKATNPVKFYEYLSAGKKIVATEIPELEPFRNQYVYLANQPEQFLNYVNLCLEGKDELATKEECITFAKTQDWQSRCSEMEEAIQLVHPLVSIIIITFNNLEITKKCIQSIIEKTAYPNYEVIIVDNDSKDDTPSYLMQLQEEHKEFKVILNKENLGFAGGNNVGIRAAQGDYIILLNNDTLVTRGWINGLIKHLDQSDVGFVGPVTNSAGNESQINIGYKDTKDMESFAMRYTTDHFNELYYNIRVLAMFCVAIKREVFNEIGYLDENYLVGMFEDDDYSMAITRKGYKIACAEDVFIHHFGRASFSKIEDQRYKQIFEHNKKYYEDKWNTLWIPHKYRPGVC